MFCLFEKIENKQNWDGQFSKMNWIKIPVSF